MIELLWKAEFSSLPARRRQTHSPATAIGTYMLHDRKSVSRGRRVEGEESGEESAREMERDTLSLLYTTNNYHLHRWARVRD